MIEVFKRAVKLMGDHTDSYQRAMENTAEIHRKFEMAVQSSMSRVLETLDVQADILRDVVGDVVERVVGLTAGFEQATSNAQNLEEIIERTQSTVIQNYAELAYQEYEQHQERLTMWKVGNEELAAVQDKTLSLSRDLVGEEESSHEIWLTAL